MTDEPKNSRDLLRAIIDRAGIKTGVSSCEVSSCLELIDAYVEARIREAEAAMAERCADVIARIALQQRQANWGDIAAEILALSPDPHWLQQKKLDAKQAALTHLHLLMPEDCCETEPCLVAKELYNLALQED